MPNARPPIDAPRAPEEQQIRERYRRGETLPAIARTHRRSPRAIELRLQRMRVLPSERPS